MKGEGLLTEQPINYLKPTDISLSVTFLVGRAVIHHFRRKLCEVFEMGIWHLISHAVAWFSAKH